jgi:hypothetical protein
MVDDRYQPAKDKAHAIGIVDGRTPQKVIEGVEILVVVMSEIVAQQSNDPSRVNGQAGACSW